MQDEKILEGICCEVENCVHNNGNCCCTAQEKKSEKPHGRPR